MNRHLCFVAALGMCIAESSAALAQQVKADSGGIAIGGSVSSSTINIGILPEQLAALIREANHLSETQQKLIANLEARLDLNQRQIRAALAILGETDVAPERLAAKLVEIAERFKALQASTLAQSGDNPQVAALKADVRKAIDLGDLARADALLADVETNQRHDIDRLAINVADTASRRGEIALTRSRYREAAKHFADAADVISQGNAFREQRIGYLRREAQAFYRQGDEFGDNSASRSGIDRYKRLLNVLSPEERATPELALIQNGLGIAITKLGEREGGTVHLDEAVTVFREALKELTREHAPLQWATTQNNLGNALRDIGERESGTAHLKEAVAAFRETLKEYTRERLPLVWGLIQSNLGNALSTLGQRESSSARLEEAVSAFRDALQVQDRERAPLDWAMVHNNLGIARWKLGGRESEAITAFRDSLKERTHERVPLLWAGTQNGLGNALRELGKRERDTARLEEAVLAYSEALKEYRHERLPLQWAMSEALMFLAAYNADLPMAERAMSQITEAVKTFRGAHFMPFATYYEAKERDCAKLVLLLRKRCAREYKPACR
jgi:tetratricopeptide (TPR) repeat protein